VGARLQSGAKRSWTEPAVKHQTRLAPSIYSSWFACPGCASDHHTGSGGSASCVRLSRNVRKVSNLWSRIGLGLHVRFLSGY
jgi:hypothetical protein